MEKSLVKNSPIVCFLYTYVWMMDFIFFGLCYSVEKYAILTYMCNQI